MGLLHTACSAGESLNKSLERTTIAESCDSAHPVNQRPSVKMVNLVLIHARLKTLAAFLELVTVNIQRAHRDPCRPLHPACDIGQRKATFFMLLRAGTGDNNRINVNLVIFRVSGNVCDEKS